MSFLHDWLKEIRDEKKVEQVCTMAVCSLGSVITLKIHRGTSSNSWRHAFHRSSDRVTVSANLIHNFSTDTFLVDPAKLIYLVTLSFEVVYLPNVNERLVKLRVLDAKLKNPWKNDLSPISISSATSFKSSQPVSAVISLLRWALSESAILMNKVLVSRFTLYNICSRFDFVW